MAQILVAVGPEHGEGVGTARTYRLADLSVLQLAYVLDDLVDELDSRGVWAGPRPKLRLAPIRGQMIARESRALSSSRIPSVSND